MRSVSPPDDHGSAPEPVQPRLPDELLAYRDEWDYLDDDHPRAPFEPGDYIDDQRRW